MTSASAAEGRIMPMGVAAASTGIQPSRYEKRNMRTIATMKLGVAFMMNVRMRAA